MAEKKLEDYEIDEVIEATDGGKSFTSISSNKLAKEVKELRLENKLLKEK